MRNDGDFSPADAPHASEYLDQALAAGQDREAGNVRVDDVMERALGLSDYPSSKREARERSRPVSDPAPFEVSESPDTEQPPVHHETVDDKLDRLFGVNDPDPTVKPQRAEKAGTEQQQPKQEPDALRHNDEAVWTASEVELISRCESERLYLDQQVARFNDLAAQIDRIEPSKRADFEFNLSMARQELEQRTGMLDQALDGLRQSYEGRQQARGQRYRETEIQKLKSALPDIDFEKTRHYGRSLGFSDQQLESVVDHREVAVLDKARRYDELMAKQRTQPKVARRVTRKGDDRAKLERAHQTGKYDGIDGALDRRLDEIFR
jgi:hypothetical protein